MSSRYLRDRFWPGFTETVGLPENQSSAPNPTKGFFRSATTGLVDVTKFLVVDCAMKGFAEGLGLRKPESETSLPPHSLAELQDKAVQGWMKQMQPGPVVRHITGPRYSHDCLPLSANKKYFRILRLLPGSADDDIKCELQIYDFDQAPPFEALSYCWGDPDDTVSIAIHGDVLPITRNLAFALCDLRKLDSERYLWADAICINQTDDSEKTVQVNMMADIYRRASCTLVYLGVHWDGYAPFVQSMLDLVNEPSQLRKEPMCSSKAVEEPPSQESTRDSEIEDTVTNLLTLPYFRRAWVVQEVAVSQRAKVILKNQELDWDVFCQGIRVAISKGICQTAVIGILRTDKFQDVLAIDRVRQHIHGTASETLRRDLLDLLVEFRRRKATDRRDKVFSLLNLRDAKAQEVSYLQPDYTLSPEDVYLKTAATLILETGNLDVLGACSTDAQSNSQTTLASWVPDWSRDRSSANPLYKDALGSLSDFRASKDSAVAPCFSENQTVLVLCGYVLDHIAEISDVREELVDSEFNELQDFDDYLDDTSSASSSDATKSPLAEIKSGFAELKGAFRHASSGTSYLLRISHILMSHQEVYVRWEKLADLGNKNKTPAGETTKSVYIQTLCAGCLPGGYEKIEADFDQWSKSLNMLRRLSTLGLNRFPRLHAPLALMGFLQQTWNQYSAFGELLVHTSQRRLGRTKEGLLCLVPASTMVGDAVGLFRGGKVPLIIRRNGSTWTLVGESYVHGIMHGEAFEDEKCQSMELA